MEAGGGGGGGGGGHVEFRKPHGPAHDRLAASTEGSGLDLSRSHPSILAAGGCGVSGPVPRTSKTWSTRFYGHPARSSRRSAEVAQLAQDDSDSDWVPPYAPSLRTNYKQLSR